MSQSVFTIFLILLTITHRTHYTRTTLLACLAGPTCTICPARDSQSSDTLIFHVYKIYLRVIYNLLILLTNTHRTHYTCTPLLACLAGPTCTICPVRDPQSTNTCIFYAYIIYLRVIYNFALQTLSIAHRTLHIFVPRYDLLCLEHACVHTYTYISLSHKTVTGPRVLPISGVIFP